MIFTFSNSYLFKSIKYFFFYFSASRIREKIIKDYQKDRGVDSVFTYKVNFPFTTRL